MHAATAPPQPEAGVVDEGGMLLETTPSPPSGFPIAPSLPFAQAAIGPPVDPGAPHAATAELARSYRLTTTAADWLARSGRRVAESTERWLDPKLSQLTPPDGMVDRMAAAERIARAIERGEPIVVFGDYDCDGITSTAIVTSVLRELGATVRPLLATRTEGAYGLSAPALRRVKATGARLLVTCDCGSSDHERIADARASGIETIVIDHHLVPSEPLPAVAFLNPHRPDCGFPYKGLASCGLALSLGAALRQRMGRELDLRPLLDLVAIGTIADVAPLDGDNRALVRAGLARLALGTRPGLRALGELAKLDLSRGVSAEDVGFRIAPRLNAPGRLGDPDEALALLLAKDVATAQGLAAHLEQVQNQRRALQARIVDEATEDLLSEGIGDRAGLVLARPGWHPGIVGIVAGKVADRTGRPTIVVGLEGDAGRGSVRGPSGFPLYDALSLCSDTLVGFGGHQAAAGVHVRSDRIAALRDAWDAACIELARGQAFAPGREPTVRLFEGDDPNDVVRDLERFEPFGAANPAPLVLLDGARVVSARNLKGHLKLELQLGSRRLGGIAFSRGEAATEAQGRSVQVVASLRRSTYHGGVEVHVERTWPALWR